MPEISIIIVNWNGRRFLQDCLGALRHQVFQDFEVIFVDNGSNDGSVEYVSANFPEAQVVALGYNSGFAVANLCGYERSRGELIVLLNNDTEAHPLWLQELHQAACKFPQAGAFASKMLFFDDRTRIDNCGFWVTTAGCAVELGRDEADGPEWSQYRWVFGACGGAVAYRRTMLDDVGFLDPDFFMIYEDMDLSFRAQLRGYSCLFFPGIVYHRYNASIKKFPAQQVFLSQRNIEYVYWKNMPGGMMIRFLHQRLLYELGSAVFFIRRGALLPFLKSKLAALAQMPTLLRKRAGIQSRRTASSQALRSVMLAKWIGAKWRRFVSAWLSNPDALVTASPKTAPTGPSQRVL